eukprot:Nk52_evm48s32 gene=Nk52_evmTU48s32
MIVGLTGGIATGKSTVSAHLGTKKGVVIIDADLIAKEVVLKGRPAWKKIVKEFGEEILMEDGQLDRAKLGDLIFNDEAKRKKLNGITHPAVFYEMGKQVLFAIVSLKPLIVLDVPLLFESGKLLYVCNCVITVACDADVELERLMARNQLSEADARARIDSQMSLVRKCELSDHVIDNNGSKRELLDKVDALYEEIYPSWTVLGVALPCMAVLVGAFWVFWR